jgi:hypothetical protein
MNPIQIETTGSCLVGSTDLFGCAMDTIVGAFGGPGVFGLLVGGVLILALFLAGNGNITTPAVVLVLIGGVTFPLLTGSYGAIARSFTFLALAAAVFAVLRRYVLEGPA